MQPPAKFAVAVVLTAGLGAKVALADGGQIRASERHGDVRITVFTSPNPLRAGPVDVSVLVQDALTGQFVSDAAVVIDTRPPPQSPHMSIRSVATQEAATNKLLRAAKFELPAPGKWDVCVEVRTPRSVSPRVAKFSMDAGQPLPQWLAVWPWFGWPMLVVLLFGVHRALVARRQTRHRVSLGGMLSAPSDARAHPRNASQRTSASLRNVPHGSSPSPRPLTPSAS